ncbi:MAG: hypothetical protein M1834_006081 [Cirrosporium novae-zelandiae]|nr:MAG: hypothetical protein M1834_006081 [Cirrosporium novae-zelandiae]
MGKKRSRSQANKINEEQPPPGCQHYSSISEVPWDNQSYWHQRYSLFSRYDEGIWLTDDAWFGVTPEPVAEYIAEHTSTAISENKSILIDAFAGAGGNTIAFAKSGRWKRVYGVEKDPAVLACAKHNAEIYGVSDLITWYEGDCFEVLDGPLKDTGEYAVVFASPPWGGPGYRSDEIFNLTTMQPYSLEQLYRAYAKLTPDIILYLPRTSDLRQLAKYASEENRVKVMHYCMEGASKALCAYYGSFQWPADENGVTS